MVYISGANESVERIIWEINRDVGAYGDCPLRPNP